MAFFVTGVETQLQTFLLFQNMLQFTIFCLFQIIWISFSKNGHTRWFNISFSIFRNQSIFTFSIFLSIFVFLCRYLFKTFRFDFYYLILFVLLLRIPRLINSRQHKHQTENNHFNRILHRHNFRLRMQISQDLTRLCYYKVLRSLSEKGAEHKFCKSDWFKVRQNYIIQKVWTCRENAQTNHGQGWTIAAHFLENAIYIHKLSL